MKVREVRIEGNIAYVTLTKGYEAVIDIADLDIVGNHNWCVTTGTQTMYAMRTDISGPRPKTVFMHRSIMNEPVGLDVDHVDCDGLNNKRENLRVATRTQNLQNQRLKNENTSGYKGVSWDKKRKKWRAQIRINKKSKCLGRHRTAKEAHAAYCAASKKFHAEFGRAK